MNQERRTQLAQLITENELWELAKRELPQHLYTHFRDNTDPAMRARIALAHDIFDDVVRYIESQMAMGQMIDFPKTGETQQ